jgi:uncharacterized membrane protein YgaE (UPF0421/DUF939 family)
MKPVPPDPPAKPAVKHTHFEAFIFSLKAAIAAVIAVLIFGLFGLPGPVWAAVSAVIVTEPNLHPSVKSASYRVIANLIGAFVGAALGTLIGPALPALAIGIVVTGIVCHFMRLDDALRPAYSAVVIVILASEGSKWVGSLDRVFAVALGCLCALAVGFLFDKLAAKSGTPLKDGQPEPQKTDSV